MAIDYTKADMTFVVNGKLIGAFGSAGKRLYSDKPAQSDTHIAKYMVEAFDDYSTTATATEIHVQLIIVRYWGLRNIQLENDINIADWPYLTEDGKYFWLSLLFDLAVLDSDEGDEIQ